MVLFQMSSGCEIPLLVDDWFGDYATQYLGDYNNPILFNRVNLIKKPVQWNNQGVLNASHMGQKTS